MIGGCLSSRCSAWEDRGADVWVVQVLREGYVVPFHTPPLSQVPVTLHSYSPQSIKGRVLKLEIQAVAQGCNRTGVPDSGILQPHFLVTKASGGWRSIIDLSTLNNFVMKTPFRMETTQSVRRSIRRNDWMASVDLKDAYLQVLFILQVTGSCGLWRGAGPGSFGFYVLTSPRRLRFSPG